MNKASFDKLTTVTKDRLTYFFFILLSFILVNNFSLGIVEFNYPILDDIQLYKKIISGSFIFHDGFFFLTGKLSFSFYRYSTIIIFVLCILINTIILEEVFNINKYISFLISLLVFLYPANNIIFYFRISAYHLYFLFHYLLFVFLFFKYKDNKFYTPQVLYYLVLILSLTSGIVGFSISMVSFFIMTTYKIYKKKFYKLDGLFAFIILLIIPTLLYKYLNHPYTNMPGRLNYEFFSLIQTFCKIFYNFVNIILSNNISNIIANKKINLEFYNYILVFCYLVIFFNYYFFNILIKKHFFLLKESCLFFFFIVSLVINASNVLLSHKWHFVLMAYFFFMHLYVFLFRITFWKNIFIKGLILSSLICLLFLFINGQIKERKKHYNILKSVDQLVQNINNFNFKSNSLIIYKNPIPYSGLSENFRLKSLIYNFINLKNNPTNVRFENYKKDILILNNNKFKNFYIIDGKLGNKIFLQN